MVSLNPADAIEVAGIIDDVDVRLTNCRFCEWDYNGKFVTNPKCAMAIDLQSLEEDAQDEEPITQYWNMGDAADWKPSEDGKSPAGVGTRIVSTGNVEFLNASTNGMKLFQSLVDAGFPADDLGDDLAALEGLAVHVKRVPSKRKGLERTDGRPDTVLVVSAILEEEKPAKGKKAARKTPVAAAGTDSPELAERATGILVELLTEHPDGIIAKREVPAKLVPKVKGDKDKNAIISLLFKDEFLSSGPWTYENGMIKLG